MVYNNKYSFLNTNDYIFISSSYLIENCNELFFNKEKENTYLLGKFISFSNAIEGMDIIPEGKAIFENGTINLLNYRYIIEK